ncbi:MAG: 4-hydroxythreonine-4-phosphate dehydrogenase PdxA [Bacteroidia bacterium]|jgi:4-hydroxythreonine-4-phosphate dehydrogenase|nr:4-hydroxythreonine-4-phosphate dehydrogenase PdxA [Bacteroidia bacterium]
MSKLPIIGITIGDVNSISIEVIIKTLADSRIADYCTPVVYGSPKIISYWKKALNLTDFNLYIIKDLDQIHHKKSNILVCWEDEVEIKPGEVTVTAGKYALKSLERATQDAVSGKIHGIVTGPLNKHNVNSDALPFTGHTEYLASAANTSDYIMMLVSESLKVGLVTGHVPISDVASKITKDAILKKLRIMNQSLKKDFSITKPKIAVLGLNPHAGDNGLLGNEDKDVIAEAVKMAQSENMIVYGPYPADGFFGSRQFEKFDAVLAMYHDQGLIPFKYLAFDDGVNYTAGLPFVRTSPDHGTAYAIAGKNQASETSLRNALYMAIDIIRTRNENFKASENPLPFSPLRKERFRIDF